VIFPSRFPRSPTLIEWVGTAGISGYPACPVSGTNGNRGNIPQLPFLVISGIAGKQLNLNAAISGKDLQIE